MRAYRLAYDGRPFAGFQRQPDVETVEGTLFAALAELDLLAGDAAAPPGYAAAGRTDAGVSAVAQTVAFDAPDWCTPRALNGALPESIRAWASADVPGGFHATHDASRREYTSFLAAPDADIERAREVASRLSGEHDLHNLTSDDAGTVRDLTVDVDGADGFLVLTVAGDGFPRQLVRRLATLVDQVSADDAPVSFVDRVLGPEPLEGAEGIGPAPPGGLVLTAVDYPDVTFSVDPDALAAAGAAVAERYWAARTRSRALGRVLDGLGE